MLLLTDRVEQGQLQEETDAAERRRGLRVRQNRPVTVLDPYLGRTFAGHTRDISATGLRIEVPPEMALRIGSILNLHVGLSPTGAALPNRRSLLPVRVVWVERSRRTGKPMLAGVEFAATISAQRHAA